MQVTPTTPTALPIGHHAERPTLPDTGFVRQKLLLRFVPFSKSTLWRRVKAGQLPAPVKLSERSTAWRVGDLRAALASLSA